MKSMRPVPSEPKRKTPQNWCFRPKNETTIPRDPKITRPERTNGMCISIPVEADLFWTRTSTVVFRSTKKWYENCHEHVLEVEISCPLHRMKLIVMKHYYLTLPENKFKRTFLKQNVLVKRCFTSFGDFVKTQLSKVSTMLRFDSPDPGRNTYPNCSFFSSYKLPLNDNGGGVEGELNMAGISS